MEKNQNSQTPTRPQRAAADGRELALSKIQAALLEQEPSFEQAGGFDPYNCRQGSNRAEVWAPRRR